MNGDILPAGGAELAIITEKPATVNPAVFYLVKLAASSRNTMTEALNQAAALLGAEPVIVAYDGQRKHEENVTYRHVDWYAVDLQAATALRAKLGTALLERTGTVAAPGYRNLIMTAVRCTLKAAKQLTRQHYQRAILGATSAEERGALAVQSSVTQDSLQDAIEALKDYRANKADDDLPGRALEDGEVRALLKVCVADDTPAGARDAAIIALGLAAGPRRAEIVGLDVADLAIGSDREQGTLTIRHGKGDKQRKIPVNNGTLDALQDWLFVRGKDAGPLFLPVNKGGRIIGGQRLTSQAILNMVVKRAQEAEIDTFSPHDLRRTFISNLLEEGADVVTAQRLAGHANVATTARYDRRGDRAKRKAVGLLRVPYRRRYLDLQEGE